MSARRMRVERAMELLPETDDLIPLRGALVCAEAGATVFDLHGRPLVDFNGGRRTIVAAATDVLAEELRRARLATAPLVPDRS